MSLIKLIARRKRLGKTNPLLNPRVVVERKVRQKNYGKLRDVVIICISGRGGGVAGPNGMTFLRDELRTSLFNNFGSSINPENIFHRSWNIDHDNDPRFFPLVRDLLQEIDRRTTKPSYVAIIGHSFGGWAACRLSRVTNKTPDFIGLVDPVFGIKNNLIKPRDVPRGTRIMNWFQDNAITIFSECLNIIIPCKPPVNGLSCGFQNVPGARINRVEFLRTATGKILTTNCLRLGIKRLRAAHTSIDADFWIRRQISNQIISDLRKLIQ